MGIIRMSGAENMNSIFSSESAAKDYLAGDNLLNIEKVLGIQKKIAAQLSKTKLEGKNVGRGGKTVQFEVYGKKTAFSKALRGRFPRKNPEGILIDVVEDAKNKGKFKARIQSPTAITPKLKAEVTALLGAAQELKPTSVFVIGAKAKTAKYAAAKAKKSEDFTYRTRRAVRVAERTKAGQAKVLIEVYPKGVLPKVLEAQMNDAARACASHMTRVDKVKAKITKDRSVVKDVKDAAYGKVVTEISGILAAQGIDAKKLVLGKTMMGQSTLYVQLPSKNVITIGLSDVKAMNAAKKASEE